VDRRRRKMGETGDLQHARVGHSRIKIVAFTEGTTGTGTDIGIDIGTGTGTDTDIDIGTGTGIGIGTGTGTGIGTGTLLACVMLFFGGANCGVRP
jgi:hypothetical protein